MKIRWWLLIALVAGAIFAGGLWLGSTKVKPEVVTVVKTVEKPVIKETVKYVTQTQVKYVSKKQGEKTDVELNVPPPKVHVTLNDKPYSFDLLANENQKFDKGKLVLEQSGDIKIIIKEEKPKNFNVGIGYGSSGISGTIGGQIGNSDLGWWLYGDKESQSIGLSIRF